MREDHKAAVDFLIGILKTQPGDAESLRMSNEEIISPIRHLMTKGFNFDDFEGLARLEEFRGIEGTETRKDGSIAVYYAIGHNDYRAIIVKDPEKGLLLDHLASQCVACFGDGVLDGEPCYLCNGIGWGLA